MKNEINNIFLSSGKVSEKETLMKIKIINVGGGANI